METTIASVSKIEKELNESFFVKCCKRYLINIFYIEKVYIESSLIELKLGKKIPITRSDLNKFVKKYIKSMNGYGLCED